MARILVVDDQPHLTYIVGSWLGRHGHAVECVDDGAVALERLRSDRFDILVTDVDMPGMDGLTLLGHRDVTERLRGIIVLTGRTDFARLHLAEEQSSIHVMPKPFSPTKIVATVNELLRREYVSAE